MAKISKTWEDKQQRTAESSREHLRAAESKKESRREPRRTGESIREQERAAERKGPWKAAVRGCEQQKTA